VHERHDNEPDKGREKKPDREIHDRFNHGTCASNSCARKTRDLPAGQRVRRLP
jgi:hypothetical protein